MSELLEPIAIIGIAGRFPGARDVDQFWDLVREGREAVVFPSDAQLLAAGVPAASLRDPHYVKAVAQAPDLDRFDTEFFGLTPREAQVCDPQLRLFLETAHAAMDNAGYPPGRMSDVGVFGSTGPNHYLELVGGGSGPAARSAAGMSVQSMNYPDYLATWVSYRFGLSGPSMTVQTACSSGLVAVALAMNALRLGECGLALAGAADIELPLGHGHWWSLDGPLSRDGHCRPFDVEATGTLFGSGAGVVVLKRLADALADQDCVRAVLLGIAVNNDGSDKVGFTAPGVVGQATVIAEALGVAGVGPRDIDYVEAHGTATALGDAVEIAALNRAFNSVAESDLVPGSCPIGSVKGNIGHLGHASGIAGLLKVVLALEHEQLPASINFRVANPKLPLDGSPFVVNHAARAWSREQSRRRLAGVSSLGIGGTNVHVVVAEGPLRIPATPDDRPRVVVWSAAADTAERDLRDRLAAHFSADPAFSDTVATLQHGRTPHRLRAATVATSAPEAAAMLRSASEAVQTGVADQHRAIAFLFPGQGAQHVGMATGLYESEPTFTAALEEVLALLAAHELPVADVWRSATDDAELAETAVAQPLLFAVEYALAEMWSAWGVTPTAVLGHSIGELVAATRAGVLTMPDAVRLVAARVRAAGAAPPGGMLAVAAPAIDVEPLLPARCSIAAVNAPNQIVVAGPSDELADLTARLAENHVAARRLRVSRPFHSPLMAAAVAEFARAFDAVVPRPLTTPLYSAAAGGRISEQQSTDPAFWSGQLAVPIRFDRALTALLEDGTWDLLEVGPGRTLTALAAGHPSVRNGPHRTLGTLPTRGGDPSADLRSALAAIAGIWTGGREVDWTAAQPYAVRRVPAPGYPYQRSQAWADEDRAEPAPPATHAAAGAAAPASPFSVPSWVETGWRTEPASPARSLVLLPPDHERGQAMVAALQRAGMRITPMRLDVAGDADGLVRRFIDQHDAPDLVVHAATLGTWEWPDPTTVADQLDHAVHTTVAVHAAAMRYGGGTLPGLVVLTDASADVSGTDPIHPVKAALHGLVRTMALEEPRSTAKLIDVALDMNDAALVAELARWQHSETVALRGDRRWIWAERPAEFGATGTPPLRDRGVYVITGGLGGLGLAVAEGLAGTGLRPRLVLLGRRALPTGPELDRLIGAGDERLARIAAALNRLDALGAQVRAVHCDVTDRRALQRAVDVATARFGPVNGVLHLAGVPGGGMLQLRSPEQITATLDAKVAGTLSLHEVFAERPRLDFFVGFSSRAAFGGLVGGGDYAAANGFLDAFARRANLAERMLSVNWPAWRDVGMAARAGTAGGSGSPVKDVVAARRWRTTLSAQDSPILDEHRLGPVPVLPGTAQLDLVARAFAEVLGHGGASRGWRLTDVVLQRPVAVPTARELEIGFEQSGDGWRFTLRSTPMDGTERAAVVHTTGLVAATAPAPRDVDLDRVRAGLPQRVGPAPPTRGRHLLTRGPRWNCVVEIATRADDHGEQLLELELPQLYAAETDEHILHPALLDVATSAARDAERDETHVPFSYDTVLVHAKLPARVFGHVRRRWTAADTIVADIDVIAPDGRTLVEIMGFTMRRAELDLLSHDEPPRQQPAGGPGIPPEVGARLLLELLSAGSPRQVAVRPFRDGVPTGLAEPPEQPSGPVPASGRDVSDAAIDRPADGAAGGRPESLESRLATLWTAHLGVPDVRSHMDFFDLGGNSLTAVTLMSQIREQFGVELGIAALFDYPTLSALADHVRELGGR